MESESNLLAERIASARKRAGFPSQNQASQALGIGQALYNKYESGERRPGRDALVLIARGFGCRVDYLLGLEDAPSETPAAS